MGAFCVGKIWDTGQAGKLLLGLVVICPAVDAPIPISSETRALQVCLIKSGRWLKARHRGGDVGSSLGIGWWCDERLWLLATSNLHWRGISYGADQ